MERGDVQHTRLMRLSGLSSLTTSEERQAEVCVFSLSLGGATIKSRWTAVLALALLAVFVSVLPASAGPNDLKDEGVGQYTDASVANQVYRRLSRASNPMCTPSTVVAGGCRFGGECLPLRLRPRLRATWRGVFARTSWGSTACSVCSWSRTS